MQPKSVLKTRKPEFDGILDEDDSPFTENSDDSSQPNNAESTENNVSINLFNHFHYGFFMLRQTLIFFEVFMLDTV